MSDENFIEYESHIDSLINQYKTRMFVQLLIIELETIKNSRQTVKTESNKQVDKNYEDKIILFSKNKASSSYKAEEIKEKPEKYVKTESQKKEKLLNMSNSPISNYSYMQSNNVNISVAKSITGLFNEE